MTIFERLEKTANEAYPEEGRINRGFVGESLLGTGPLGYLAKKHNFIAGEEDSHAMANAKLMGTAGATTGALQGAVMGGMAGGSGGRAALGAAAGGAVGGALSGAYGAAMGGGIGKLHDKYDERLRARQGEEQTASDLLESLEKTANEAYPEEGRINRGFVGESLLGTGPLGYLAKKHNVGVNEEDSHASANAKLLGAGAAVGGAAQGAAMGGIMGGSGGRAALGAAAGGAVGGAISGAYGAAMGGGIGMLHDKYDEHLRSQQEAGVEQTASDLMESLEKTAAASISGIKNTFSAASGKGYNQANKAHKTTVDGAAKANTVEGFKANVKGAGGDVSKVRHNLEGLEKDVANSAKNVAAAKATRDQARGKLAPAAVGIAAVGGAAAGSSKKDEQQKTAQEDFMNEMYKEAATAIIEAHVPETKAYKDPMDGIKFRR